MRGRRKEEKQMENGHNQKEPRKRRNLSGEKKYQILEAIKRNPGKKSEILRREGLYRSDLKKYDEITREAGIKALGQMRPGKKRLQEVPIDRYEALKREHESKERALAELTVEFLALKKKVNGE
jgi:hypothetical protein